MIKHIVYGLAVCAVLTTGVQARTLEEVKAMGSVLACASPDALPYATNKPGLPGFQIELAQEIAKGKHRQSQPYNKSGVVLGLAGNSAVVSKQVELLQGQRIGVMINSTPAEFLGKAGASLVPYAFQSDMIEDLAKGELYGGAVSTASLSYFGLQTPQSGIKRVDMFDESTGLTWNVAVNIRNTDAAMVQAVDKVLDDLLASGKLAEIYSHYGLALRKP